MNFDTVEIIKCEQPQLILYLKINIIITVMLFADLINYFMASIKTVLLESFDYL